MCSQIRHGMESYNTKSYRAQEIVLTTSIAYYLKSYICATGTNLSVKLIPDNNAPTNASPPKRKLHHALFLTDSMNTTVQSLIRDLLRLLLGIHWLWLMKVCRRRRRRRADSRISTHRRRPSLLLRVRRSRRSGRHGSLLRHCYWAWSRWISRLLLDHNWL